MLIIQSGMSGYCGMIAISGTSASCLNVVLTCGGNNDTGCIGVDSNPVLGEFDSFPPGPSSVDSQRGD